jgi:hypothetical protein
MVLVEEPVKGKKTNNIELLEFMIEQRKTIHILRRNERETAAEQSTEKSFSKAE